MSSFKMLRFKSEDIAYGNGNLSGKSLLEVFGRKSGKTYAQTRKILIHAINYAPERIGCAKYTSELARFLQKRGHQIEVITAPPHYPEWVIERPYKTFLYKKEIIDNIVVTRCLMILRKKGAGLWRLLGPLIFAMLAAPMVIWRALRLKPDIVICVEPALFCAPAVLLASRFFGAKSFLHVQDLEVDAAFQLGFLKSRRLKQIVMSIELRLLTRFDKIVTISEKMRMALIQKGVDGEKVLVVRNWINLDSIQPIASRSGNGFRAQLARGEQDFIVLYAGAIGAKQSLNVVLDAARRLRAHNDIVFVIAGDGPAKKDLQIDYADLTNVSFLPLQDEGRLGDLLSIANIHVLPQGKAASDLVMPSKLGGMLASGRPIIVTTELGSELADVLKDIAIIVPPGDSGALANAILLAQGRDFSLSIDRGLQLSKCWNSHDVLLSFEKHLLNSVEKSKKQETRRTLPYGIPQDDTLV